MNKRRVIPIAVLVIIAAAVIFFMASRPKRDGNSIRMSGNIEVVSVELSFRIPGRMISRPLDEGMIVRRGQVAASLDPTELQHSIAQQSASLGAARAQLAELEHGSRPEDIRSGEAAVKAAQADLSRWDAELARRRDLHKYGIVALTDVEVADANDKQAREKVDQTKQALALLRKGPRVEEIEQARAKADQAQAALAESQTQLTFCTLRSPVDGVVLAKHIEPGEQVAAGTPVLTVADLHDIWLRGYIDETDLGRIQLGQKVRVTTDSFPGKVYDGTISFISSEAEFTPKTVQTQKERVKLVYRIKVTIANPNLELKPGMPADGEIIAGAR